MMEEEVEAEAAAVAEIRLHLGAPVAVPAPQPPEPVVDPGSIPGLVFDHFAQGSHRMEFSQFESLLTFPEMQSHQRHQLTRDERRLAFQLVCEGGDNHGDGELNNKGGGRQAPSLTRDRWRDWCDAELLQRLGDQQQLADQHQHPDARVRFQLAFLWAHLRDPTVVENLQRFGHHPTYYCPACCEFEICAEPAAWRTSTCEHWYCRGCVEDYLIQQISQGQLAPKCFQDDTESAQQCGKQIAEEDILQLLDEAWSSKFLRFKQQKLHPNVRRCPKCEHSQLGAPETPTMSCEQCQTSYCFWHGGIHPDRSCAEFEKKHRKELKKSEKMLKQESRPCPRCAVPITKAEGCQHCRCPNCSCSFCWRCMSEIEDVPRPRHYQFDPENPDNPCANRQFDDAPAAAEWRGIRKATYYTCLVLAGTPFVFMVVPLSVAFGLVGLILSSFVALCILGNPRTNRDRWKRAVRKVLELSALCATFLFLVAFGILIFPGFLCLRRFKCLPPPPPEPDPPLEGDEWEQLVMNNPELLNP